MASITRLLCDERSAIEMRHATLASIWAAGCVVAGIFLTVVGGNLYEQSSQHVLWALANGLAPLGA